MKVEWTYITEDKHFANGLEGHTYYWCLVKSSDRLKVDHGRTDKFGDFWENDQKKKDPEFPFEVIAFAKMEYPDIPESVLTAR